MRITKNLAASMAVRIADKKYKNKIDKMVEKIIPKVEAYVKENYILLEGVPDKYKPFVSKRNRLHIQSCTLEKVDYNYKKDDVTYFISGDRSYSSYPTPAFLNNNTVYLKSHEQLHKEHNKIVDLCVQRKAFLEKIEIQIKAFSTVKKLIDAYPKMQKYLPEPATSGLLPAAVLSKDVEEVL